MSGPSEILKPLGSLSPLAPGLGMILRLPKSLSSPSRTVSCPRSGVEIVARLMVGISTGLKGRPEVSIVVCPSETSGAVGFSTPVSGLKGSPETSIGVCPSETSGAGVTSSCCGAVESGAEGVWRNAKKAPTAKESAAKTMSSPLLSERPPGTPSRTSFPSLPPKGQFCICTLKFSVVFREVAGSR